MPGLRPAFGQPAEGLRPKAFGLRPKAFGLRPKAFGRRPPAFGRPEAGPQKGTLLGNNFLSVSEVAKTRKRQRDELPAARAPIQ